jgi:hypothetical protein
MVESQSEEAKPFVKGPIDWLVADTVEPNRLNPQGLNTRSEL